MMRVNMHDEKSASGGTMARGDLVSIICPVYNVSAYLDQMLESVRGQTYADWELILIDDGSTDGSGEICDRFCALEPRARVIHQSNQGQAAARDAGIAAHRGKWIAFIDADDLTHRLYIENLLLAAVEEGADIAECDYAEFEKDAPADTSDGGGRPGIACRIVGREMVAGIAFDCRVRVTTVWGKLFRSSLFEGISCPKGQLYEDEYLIPRLFSRASSYCLISDVLYYYRMRAGSTMAQAYDRRRALANIEVIEDRLRTFLGRYSPSTDGILLFRHCMHLCTVLERIHASENADELDECSLYCRAQIRAVGRKCLSSKWVSPKRKLAVAAAMASPRLISLFRAVRK